MVFLSGSKKNSPPALRLGDLSAVPFSRPPASPRACPGWRGVDGLAGKQSASKRSKKCTNGVGFMNVPKIPSKCGGLLSKKNWGCQIVMTSAFARIYTSFFHVLGGTCSPKSGWSSGNSKVDFGGFQIREPKAL